MRTSGTKLFNHVEQTTLIDGTDSIGGKLKRDPFVFFSKEETLGLQVRVEPALGFYIRMAHVMTPDGLLSGNLTNSGHVAIFLGRQK